MDARPGGTVTTIATPVLAVVAVEVTFVVNPVAAGVTAAIFAALPAYFWFDSRHHLVTDSPEDEFDRIATAERTLH